MWIQIEGSAVKANYRMGQCQLSFFSSVLPKTPHDSSDSLPDHTWEMREKI